MRSTPRQLAGLGQGCCSLAGCNTPAVRVTARQLAAPPRISCFTAPHVHCSTASGLQPVSAAAVGTPASHSAACLPAILSAAHAARAGCRHPRRTPGSARLALLRRTWHPAHPTRSRAPVPLRPLPLCALARHLRAGARQPPAPGPLCPCRAAAGAEPTAGARRLCGRRRFARLPDLP